MQQEPLHLQRVSHKHVAHGRARNVRAYPDIFHRTT